MAFSPTSSMSSNPSDIFSLPVSFARNITPVILVKTTEDVEIACKKNNISFIDLIRPYFCLPEEVMCRTPEAPTSYPIRDFRVRFCTMSDLERPSPEQVDAYMTDLIRDSMKEEHMNQLRISDRDELGYSLRGNPNFTPWFDKHCEEYLMSVRTAEHECFEHPVACICVVTTNHPDPAGALSKLYSPEEVPIFFSGFAIDPNIHKSCVLLHDLQCGPPDKAQSVFSKLKESQAGYGCRLVTINSRPVDTPDLGRQDIWTPCIPQRNLYYRRGPDSPLPGPAEGPTKQLSEFGKCLSDEDIHGIRSLVHSVIREDVLPAMQRKTSQINALIIAARKGIRNKFAGWFKKGEGRTDTVETPLGIKFTAASPEMQQRRFADYVFMLRDYDTALQTYKSLASDFRTDKTVKYYASVMEMIGVCTYLLGGPKKEVDSAFETAAISYAKIQDSLFSTRASLFLADTSKSKQDWRRAIEIYKRTAAEEESSVFRSAMFLEQIAMCLIRMQPAPQLRRCSFYLVLAGYRYNHSGQLKHALRCYQAALRVYENKDWSQVDEHIHLQMGRLSTFLGSLDASVAHMHDVLKNTRQSPEKQTGFLKEFMSIVKAFTHGDEEQSVPGLSLPGFVDSSVRVLTMEHGALAYTDEAESEVWKEMEEGLVSDVRPDNVSKWAASLAQQQQQQSQRRIACAVGEPVQVEVELRNPLSIPLELTNVHLTAEFTPRNLGVLAANTPSTSALGETTSPTVIHASSSSFSISSDLATPTATNSSTIPKSKSDTLLSETPKIISTENEILTARGGGSAAAVACGPFGCASPIVPLSPSSDDTASPSLPPLRPRRRSSLGSDTAPLFNNGVQESSTPQESELGGVIDAPLVSVQREYFIAEKYSLTLGPKEKRTVRLVIRPQEQGVLEVKGVKWLLFDLIHGERKFDIPGRRLNKTKQHKTGRMYEADTRLSIKCVAPMPLLSVRWMGLSSSMWQGEILRGTLEVTNNGQIALHNLRVRMSHPSFMVIGNNTPSPLPISVEHEQKDSSPLCESNPQPSLFKSSLSTIALSSVVGKLEAGQTMSVPVFVRGTKIGDHDLHFLFYYEPETPNKDVEFRLHRSVYGINVLPSILAKSTCMPSSSDSQRFLMSLHLRNANDKASLRVNQISSVSPSWRINPVPKEGISAVRLDPGDSSVAHFTITRCAVEKKDNESSATGLPSLWHNHVSIMTSPSAPSSQQQHQDSRQSPTFDFFLRECAFTPRGGPNLYGPPKQQTTTTQEIALLPPPPPSIQISRGTGVAAVPPVLSSSSNQFYPNLKKNWTNGRSNMEYEPMIAGSGGGASPQQQSIKSAQTTAPTLASTAASGHWDASVIQRFPFCAENEMAILVHWETVDSRRSGLACIPQVAFLPSTKSVFMPTQTQAVQIARDPVSVLVSFDSSVQHSFPTEGPCRVPVRFLLSNFSTCHPLQVTFEAGKPVPAANVQTTSPSSTTEIKRLPFGSAAASVPEVVPAQAQVTPSAQILPTSFYWEGTTKICVDRIEPMSKHELSLVAVFPSPGIFNLNTFQVHWKLVLPPVAAPAPKSAKAPKAPKVPLSKQQLAQKLADEVRRSKFVRGADATSSTPTSTEVQSSSHTSEGTVVFSELQYLISVRNAV